MMTEITKLKFLWNASKTWSSKNHVENILKSHYLTTCRKLLKSEDKLSQLQFNEKVMCSKCSSCWYDGNFTVKTKPKKFQGSKGRKLVELYRLGKKLTKKQKLRAKWYLKRINKQWEISCSICKNKTRVPLKKPQKIK